MVGELVVADQGAVRLAAGHAELVFVELLEDLALVELDRPVHVLEQLPLGDVQHLELQLGAGFAVHHQVVQPRQVPSSFWNSGACMTAASCLEIASSMALMPALMVRVTSLFQVTVPLRASSVRVLQQFLGAGLLGLLGGLDGLVEDAAFADLGRAAACAWDFALFAGAH